MKQTDIVKRAFHLTFRHPVLWIFGILIALTSGGSNGGGFNYTFGPSGDGRGAMPLAPGIDGMGPGAWIAIAVLCCCILLIVIVASIIVRYVSRTALFRMVDQIEEIGSKPTWREGFRLGWSNRAFRLFLLELIVGLAVGIAAIILLVAAASPLLLLLIHSLAARAAGISLAIVLMLGVILILLAAAIVLSVLGQFWSREIVLANRSIGQALAGGYELVRARIKDVGVMWLLLLAIGIGWGLVLVPIALVVVLAAAALGAGMGFSVYGVTNSIPWGVMAGLPVFLVIVIVPLTFLGGLYQVFHSGAWTLAYREVARPDPVPGDVPAPAPA
jgi:hypothetical protein